MYALAVDLEGKLEQEQLRARKQQEELNRLLLEGVLVWHRQLGGVLDRTWPKNANVFTCRCISIATPQISQLL